MAHPRHLAILRQGIRRWNRWRESTALDAVDLSGADLRGIDFQDAILRGANLSGATLDDRACFFEADLSGANLSGITAHSVEFMGANLSGADLSGAELETADFREANLRGAVLRGANLWRSDFDEAWLARADLSGADASDAHFSEVDLSRATLAGARLSGTDLSGANLTWADLREANLFCADFAYATLDGADLRGASLMGARMVGTSLRGAELSGAEVFGLSAWKVDLEGAVQRDLVITDGDEPTVTVDNLEVAQFLYLLLHNPGIRDVIDTITSKVVLILGRFTPRRKRVLDRLRQELREHDYLPVLFDFAGPSSRGLTETVSTLAHLARFVIADLTGARAVPVELQRIVPDLPSLPVQPIVLASSREYAMFHDLRPYPWVLPPFRYDSPEHLIASLREHVIAPAAARAEAARRRPPEAGGAR